MPMTITSTTVDFITQAEVLAHLNLGSADASEEITLISRAAQDHVESLVGAIRWKTITRTVKSCGVYVLGVTPVLTVDSVTFAGAPYTAHAVDTFTGIVTGLPTSGDVTITYTAGRGECPDAIRIAALIIVAHLWRTQLGGSPSGALPQEDQPQDVFGIGYAIPSRAMDLLAPYVRPGGIA